MNFTIYTKYGTILFDFCGLRCEIVNRSHTFPIQEEVIFGGYYGTYSPLLLRGKFTPDDIQKRDELALKFIDAHYETHPIPKWAIARD